MGQLGLNQETVILAWDERGRILRSKRKKLAEDSSRYFISYSWSKREEGREETTLPVSRKLVYSPFRGVSPEMEARSILDF